MALPTIQIAYPSWVQRFVDWEGRYESDVEKMLLAVEVARQNVLERTGGPFGAAIFEIVSGRFVSVGMNMVPAEQFLATRRGRGIHDGAGQTRVIHPRAARIGRCTSWRRPAKPCAMCLGATLWSGVRRVICGACREDAERLQFDEGPVFPESYAYLRQRGIEIVRGVCQGEAAAVLELYRNQNGTVYNG